MRKSIQEHLKSIYKPLNIDPSIKLRIDLSEMVDIIKITLQGTENNEIIIMNLYEVISEYFNREVVDDIFLSSIPESDYITIKRRKGLNDLLKNDDEDEEEKS